MIFDSMGSIYVTDRDNRRIQGAVNGTTIAGITSANGNSTTRRSSRWASP